MSFTTAILKAPSGKFIVVGRVPASCCFEDGRQRVYESEAETLAAILADPWIIANPSQPIQLSDCSRYEREAPRIEQTEAGAQVMIVDTPPRTVPTSALRPRRAQTDKPLALEQPAIEARQGKLF